MKIIFIYVFIILNALKNYGDLQILHLQQKIMIFLLNKQSLKIDTFNHYKRHINNLVAKNSVESEKNHHWWLPIRQIESNCRDLWLCKKNSNVKINKKFKISCMLL